MAPANIAAAIGGIAPKPWRTPEADAAIALALQAPAVPVGSQAVEEVAAAPLAPPRPVSIRCPPAK